MSKNELKEWIRRSDKAQTQLKFKNLFILIDIQLKGLHKFSREKKNCYSRKPRKQDNPQKLHKISFSISVQPQQQDWHGHACRHGLPVPVYLLWHGRASRHGAPVLNLCLRCPFFPLGTTCSCHLARPALRGTPVWVGFSSKMTFGPLFGFIFILRTKHSATLISPN